jgi:L-arabinose transport system ATP-binding protein
MNSPFELSLSGVSKRYGPVAALSDVTLTLRGGETVALMGENGAGKSTFLKIMSGIVRPDTGTFAIDGQAVAIDSPQAAHRLGIRIVPQEPDILPQLSVAENLFLGELPRLPFRIVDWRRTNEAARALMKTFRVGLNLDPRTPGSELAPAQRQMIEILRALRANPRLLALDEPTSSLSSTEANALFDVVDGLRASGVALIYVSHRMQEIRRLAQRVAVFRDGRQVADRGLGEVSDDDVVRMMVGRDLASMKRRPDRAKSATVVRFDDVRGPWLRGVSLEIRSGEVLGVTGLVGAGRTELARTLFGVSPIQGGRIEYRGRSYAPRGPADAIDQGIGYAPEERKAEALFMLQSVRENVSLVSLKSLSKLRFISLGREEQLAARFARQLRVRTPDISQPVSTLSGGNQQKVVLARWLAVAPHLLILDEPTRGIDVGAKREIYEMIDELAAKGIAIMLISSELPEVMALSDRIVVMQNGRVTAELQGETASEEQILRAAMADDLAAAV